MKRLILILLLICSFNMRDDITFLEKYGEVIVVLPTGIVYLNIQDFGMKETLHILFNAKKGYMNDIIYYDYSDKEPEDIDMNLTHSMDSTMNAETSNGNDIDYYYRKTDYTKKYYYDIEKVENKKFLIIRYSDFNGEYLEIEHNRFNTIILIIIIVSCVVGIIILIVIIAILIIVCKRRRQYNVDYSKTTPN